MRHFWLMNAKQAPRFLLKLSGELFGGDDRAFCAEKLAGVAAQLASASQNAQLMVVVGGGNILRGGRAGDLPLEQAKRDAVGMLGTLANAAMLAGALEQAGAGAEVFCAPNLVCGALAKPFVAAEACAALEAGKIVVLGGGTGNPFFSTDSAAVLRARELGCAAVLKGSRVAGVFTKDPEQHKDAQHLPQLTHAEALEQNLGIMDAAAFALAAEVSLPILVFDATKPGQILAAVRGEAEGSWIQT